jgi:proteasome accessory factor A
VDRAKPQSDPERALSSPDRQGIFGLETEYIVLYLPDVPGDPLIPPFHVLEEVLFGALLEGRKAAVSSGLKGGYFLENGGLVHLEVFLRTQEDTPIIEAATPECRSPRDLLLYQRAYDQILTDVSHASRPVLKRKGFDGRLSFGKNNRDPRGAGYGCHENYLIHDEASLGSRLLMIAGFPLVCLCLIPAVLVLFMVVAIVLLATISALTFPRLTQRIYRAWERVSFLKKELRATYFVAMNVFLFPPISIYTILLRATAFRRFQKDLTSFLVTRQIISGAGGLDLKRGFFEIAQRPRLTASLGEIIMFGRRKTIFDLKGLLYDPLALFRRRKKLTVTLGDSNLSDVSFFLKVGTTALVIEMIESGVHFDDLRLRRPVNSFRAISQGGPWKRLAVRGPGAEDSPGRLTALDVQRAYLHRAREFFAARPEGRVRHREILDLWEETLALLADHPGRLAERLDWAAKKSLLDRAILERGTWREFLAWGRIFTRATEGELEESRDLAELMARPRVLRRLRLRFLVRAALKRGDIDPKHFPAARDLYHLCRKLDLRYHEIGSDPGYQRQLEAQGLLWRLTSDEEVTRAATQPPPDTRARVRGYYIHLAQGLHSVRANWNEVEITGALHTIRLPDPFQYRVPTD